MKSGIPSTRTPLAKNPDENALPPNLRRLPGGRNRSSPKSLAYAARLETARAADVIHRLRKKALALNPDDMALPEHL